MTRLRDEIDDIGVEYSSHIGWRLGERDGWCIQKVK